MELSIVLLSLVLNEKKVLSGTSHLLFRWKALSYYSSPDFFFCCFCFSDMSFCFVVKKKKILVA